jgi:hypothetical protein
MTDILKLAKALQDSWSSETSNWGDELAADNPARGQCQVSALVLQDYLGGDIARVAVEGVGIKEKHFFNKLENGTTIDSTSMQYKDVEVTFTNSPIDLAAGSYQSVRDRCLADEDTRRRYALLKRLVAEKLGT